MIENEPKPLDEQQVVAMVKRYLEPHQPSNYRLNVLENGIRHTSDGWWKVIVRPDREDIRYYDYVARMAEAEGDIENNEDVNVLLLPVFHG